MIIRQGEAGIGGGFARSHIADYVFGPYSILGWFVEQSMLGRQAWKKQDKVDPISRSAEAKARPTTVSIL